MSCSSLSNICVSIQEPLKDLRVGKNSASFPDEAVLSQRNSNGVLRFPQLVKFQKTTKQCPLNEQCDKYNVKDALV